jgi:3-methyladenine DNA glycosylase AlkD
VPGSATLADLRSDVLKLASPERAKAVAAYFKTGPGQYGEGDKFAGLTVPQIRTLARVYKGLGIPDLTELLRSEVHEERLLALLILAARFEKGDTQTREKVFDVYVSNLARVNNWDLVDMSAPVIVGPYLQDKPKDRLYDWARSPSLWERRTAMLATFHYIRQGDPALALEIIELLLQDRQDLIHKAAGWMLREVGKRCGREVLTGFLDKHAVEMPRTMLRYAIEHFPEDQRRDYLGRRAAVKRAGSA